MSATIAESATVPTPPSKTMGRRSTFVASFGYVKQWYGSPEGTDSGRDEEELDGESQPRRRHSAAPVLSQRDSTEVGVSNASATQEMKIADGGLFDFDALDEMESQHKPNEMESQHRESRSEQVLPQGTATSPELVDEPHGLRHGIGFSTLDVLHTQRPKIVDDTLFDFDALDEMESQQKLNEMESQRKESRTEQVLPQGVPLVEELQALPRGIGFSTLDMLSTATQKTSQASATVSPSPVERQASDATVTASDGAFDFDELELALEEAERQCANSEQDFDCLESPEGKGTASQASTAASESCIRRKGRIVMVICGSRGDIAPFIALADEMILRGYAVQILTSINLVKMCEAFGIEARAAFPDSEDVLRRCGGVAGLHYWDIHADNKKHTQAWCDENPEALVDPEEAAAQFKPTLVIGSNLSWNTCVRIEAKLEVPAIPVFLEPESMGLQRPSVPSVPARPELLAGRNDASKSVKIETYPNLLVTPAMRPREDNPLEAEGLKALEEFLHAGPKPVAFGWGSMTMKNMGPAGMLGLALKSLYMMGRRGVILGGWAHLEDVGRRLVEGKLTAAEVKTLGPETERLAAYARDNVFFISEAPHSWLLPRCSCFVNHGGAGTVEGALRAGCPLVATPIFGDQYEHAAFVQRLGFGRGFSQSLAELDVTTLMQGIRYSEKCKQAVTKAAEEARREEELASGAVSVAKIIDNFMSRASQWHSQLQCAVAQKNSSTAAAIVAKMGKAKVKQPRSSN